jgi:hypothetical protein
MHRSCTLYPAHPESTVQYSIEIPEMEPFDCRSSTALPRILSGSPDFSTGKCLNLKRRVTFFHLKYKMLWLPLDMHY